MTPINSRFRTAMLCLTTIAGSSLTSAALAGDCPADLDGTGDVGFSDLLELLVDWGPCPGCPSDLDGSGDVAFADLLELLAAWGPCPGAGTFTSIELAGDPLAEYPFFHFVNVFNEGEPASIAIDPGNFPEGATPVDIYITADKTAAGWDGDPSLVDVRGTSQSATLIGPSIQGNTVELTDSGTLDADAGLDIGVGYDVVIDFNQNGTLDSGDYIDGYGDIAGMYVVHDLSQGGPLSVTELTYDLPGWSGQSGFQGENTFFPTDIASMGQLPLIIVSRGNGHNHNWYDHIGEHMASYGYVVMSHNNNTVPGIDTAALTTVQHTDQFITQAEAGNIPGGATLAGHLDTSRIIWIGHSRGGEGVVRAYNSVVTGAQNPVNYDADDIIVVNSMCPTYFSPGTTTNPHDVFYHLFYTGADSDVSGSPTPGSSKPLAIYDKAEGEKGHDYFHGAGHGDFHNGGGNPFQSGPDPIGEAGVHPHLLSQIFVIAEHYNEGNVPAREFLTRSFDDFHAPGVLPNVVVAREFHEAAADPGVFVVDDYQTQASAATSSSGGSVSFNVLTVNEGQLMDVDSAFDWSVATPFNGMTRWRHPAVDDSRGTTFNWLPFGTSFYEQSIIDSQQDLSDDTWLSFRAAQMSRHPSSDQTASPISFSVTLRDGSGTTSTINFGAYGTQITRTYQRTGFGAGAGWANEFATVRIRLTDFTHNNSGLDLTDVEAIRFEFGTGFSELPGAIGMDDIMIIQ